MPGGENTDVMPVRAFGAPHTTWIGLPSPASTMQTRRRSAFGCCLASSTFAITNGANVKSAPYGQHTLIVTATDLSGNTSTATVPYTVGYRFSGFFPPVDNPPILNVANAGSSVPVIFSLGGNQGLAILAASFDAVQ